MRKLKSLEVKFLKILKRFRSFVWDVHVATQKRNVWKHPSVLGFPGSPFGRTLCKLEAVVASVEAERGSAPSMEGGRHLTPLHRLSSASLWVELSHYPLAQGTQLGQSILATRHLVITDPSLACIWLVVSCLTRI